MAIGSLALTPSFDENTTSYSVTTTNATNTVTAVAYDSSAGVSIECNGNPYDSGDAITWHSGLNTVNVTVANFRTGTTKLYTVAVTKE